jgi:3-deoxy-D-manno-octulosonate 8-phosphate phosphatase (KDO 8-P phosphatase)
LPPEPAPSDGRPDRGGAADPGPGTHAIWDGLPEPVRQAFARVEAVVMDADGVLTDGRITISSDGTESMTFHVRDGSGTWMLHKSGLKVGVITGRDTGILERGNGGLKLDRIVAGSRAKGDALLHMLDEWGLTTEACVFIGDDILDAPALRTAGVPVCVADATREVREMALYVTHRGGGHGAVREVADLVLHARGLRDALVASFTGKPPAGAAEQGE